MEILLPKLLGDAATYRIRSYKGIGHIPKNLQSNNDVGKRLLLNQLPRLLRGYGKVPHIEYVIIICDLDNRNKKQFLTELKGVLDACNPKPNTRFCLAIEEFEAWYLGDFNAIRKAYPKARNSILNKYVNDDICDTWELLADAVYKGGSRALTKEGWQAVGKQKSIWAQKISPHMNVEDNDSPSFQFLRTKIRQCIAQQLQKAAER
jgi:hypothetical protein